MKTKTTKKLFAFIIIILFFFSATEAQVTYTNVNPDAKFSCSKAGCSHQYNLDLNNDGINDFTIMVSEYLSFCGSNDYNLSVSITTLDSNGVVATNPLPLNAIINDQSLYTTSATLESSYWYVNPRRGGCHSALSGGWSSSADGYIGLKLIKGGKTYYGWARLLVSVSSKSASFTIKDYAYNSIRSQLILAGQSTNLNVVVTSAITGSPFCAGSNVSVPYEVAGTFNASNIFTAQLSDSTGSFVNPVTIGSKQSAVAGTINAKIPLSTLTGSQYRIRVISSSSSYASYDNGMDIIIHHKIANAVISAGGATEFCSGVGVVALSTSLMYGYTFQWLNNGISITNDTVNQIWVNSSGNYQCVVTDGCGNDTSNTIIVTADPLPDATITASGPTIFCKGGSVTLYANTGAGLTYKWIVYPSGDTVSTNSFYVAADTINHYYEVKETSAKGCVNYSNLIFVEVDSSKEPNPKINAIGNTTFCAGDSVILIAAYLNYTSDQFQWKKNGANISGAISSFYYAKIAGTYTCKVTNVCGSTTTPGITITVNTCFTANNAKSSNAIIANKQNTKTGITVIPNPVKNSLRVNALRGETLTGKSATATINIYSAAMQLVQTIKVTQADRNIVTISVSRLTAGVYFLQLVNTDGISTVKFVKE